MRLVVFIYRFHPNFFRLQIHNILGSVQSNVLCKNEDISAVDGRCADQRPAVTFPESILPPDIGCPYRIGTAHYPHPFPLHSFQSFGIWE